MHHILESFHHEFPPVHRSVGYRFGILAVAVGMVLLAAVYFSLVAGVLALIVWHATSNTGVFRRVGAFWSLLLLYIFPLCAGVILFISMVKPLFARPGKRHVARPLSIGRDPLLFAFVARIARAVGAPQPQRIEIHCCANASASTGLGFAGLLGRKLVLSIGLPFVGGLTMAQLAGILAHELGHFSQGAGVRVVYWISYINGWFERLVYERDGWDEMLETSSEEGGFLTLLFLMARFFVWVTRSISCIFMMLGHALCCFLVRQGEYAADRYGVRLVGSEIYEETLHRSVILSIAESHAERVLNEALVDGQLPVNLPALIVATADLVPREMCRAVEKAVLKERTTWFDTHPAYSERRNAIRREQAAGIFQSNRPAALLFSDFAKLSETATNDLYRRALGKKR